MASTEVILLVFGILGFLIPIGTIEASLFLREPNRKEFAKYTAFECGEIPIGDNRAIGFQYYQYALLFLVFEVSIILFFLWGSTVQKDQLQLPFLIFIGLLLFAVFYATREREYYVA